MEGQGDLVSRVCLLRATRMPGEVYQGQVGRKRFRACGLGFRVGLYAKVAMVISIKTPATIFMTLLTESPDRFKFSVQGFWYRAMGPSRGSGN